MQTPADHTIRPARPADVERIVEIYAGYVETSVSTFEEQAPTAAQMQRRMDAAPRLPWLVAVDAHGDVVGYSYASPHHVRSAYRWSLNCSIFVHESAQGRGVASALYDELIGTVRGLGYVSLFAGITLPNDGSVALHERLGFQRVAVYPHSGFKLGAWHDVGWWWLPLRDPPEQPSEPSEWDQVG